MFIIPVLLVSDKVDDVDPAKKENMLDGLLGHLFEYQSNSSNPLNYYLYLNAPTSSC